MRIQLAVFLICIAPAISFSQTSTEVPSASADDVSEICCIAEIKAYSWNASDLLFRKEFDALETLAERERSTKARFPGGVWKLHALYAGLEKPIDNDWESHIARLEAWKAAKPTSVTARIALAEGYLQYGWEARGTGYADKVTQEGWKKLDERTSAALKELNAAAALKVRDPHYFETLLSVGQVRGWDSDQARKIVDQAIEVEPSYYYTYRTYAGYMLPKWYGEPGDSERIAEEIANKIGGKLGDAMYAEIAPAMYCGCGKDSDIHMSFERIVRGYKADEELYGVSLEKINKLAYIAVNLGEPDEANRAFQRLGSHWDRATWKLKQNYDQAKHWAELTSTPGNVSR